MPHRTRIPPRSHEGRRTSSVSCRVSVSSPSPLFPALQWKRTSGRSVSRLSQCRVFSEVRTAERRGLRSHAERGNEGARGVEGCG